MYARRHEDKDKGASWKSSPQVWAMEIEGFAWMNQMAEMCRGSGTMIGLSVISHRKLSRGKLLKYCRHLLGSRWLIFQSTYLVVQDKAKDRYVHCLRYSSARGRFSSLASLALHAEDVQNFRHSPTIRWVSTPMYLT